MCHTHTGLKGTNKPGKYSVLADEVSGVVIHTRAMPAEEHASDVLCTNDVFMYVCVYTDRFLSGLHAAVGSLAASSLLPLSEVRRMHTCCVRLTRAVCMAGAPLLRLLMSPCSCFRGSAKL